MTNGKIAAGSLPSRRLRMAPTQSSAQHSGETCSVDYGLGDDWFRRVHEDGRRRKSVSRAVEGANRVAVRARERTVVAPPWRPRRPPAGRRPGTPATGRPGSNRRRVPDEGDWRGTDDLDIARGGDGRDGRDNAQDQGVGQERGEQPRRNPGPSGLFEEPSMHPASEPNGRLGQLAEPLPAALTAATE